MPNYFNSFNNTILMFLLAVFVLGLIAFLVMSNLVSFRGLYGHIFPRSPSHASIAKDFGVNLSGAEFGASGAVGTIGRDYFYYTDSTIYNYYSQKGLKLVRIPFTWERVQPQAMGSLSTTDLAGLKSMLDTAAATNTKVILDLHNFARYYNVPMTTADSTKFADVWTKLATQFKDHPALYGYELMNEPHDMPEGSSGWATLAQAATNAIRQVDTTHYILIPGYSWQSARFWQDNNANLAINDPAGKLLYSAHLYFDADYSGTYSQSYDASGAYPTMGVDRVQPFLDWLAQKNVMGILTEYGVPGNDPRWLTVLDNFEQTLNQNDHIVGGTYWSAGPWWGGYPLSLQPTGAAPSYIDTAQMAIVQKYPTTDLSTSSISPSPSAATSSSPVAGGNTSLTVYDDDLSSLFENFSYGGNSNFSSTLNPYAGAKDIQMQVTGATFGINLHAVNPINISLMKSLDFAGRVDRAGSSYAVALDDGSVQKSVPLSTFGGDFFTSWKTYSIPLSQFGGLNLNSISAVTIKEMSDSTSKTVFVDNIKFSPISAQIPGDIDRDGKVSIFDYSTLVSNYGKTGTNIPGDLDNSGQVDIFDYSTLVSNYGKFS